MSELPTAEPPGPPSVAARLQRSLAEIFRIDLRSLVLFRIGLGLLVFAEVCDRVVGFHAQYTEAGVAPATAVRELIAAPLSLMLLNDSALFAAVIFAATAIASLMLIAGWHTRLATVVAFVLLVSIQGRNPLINHHGDALMRHLLMWGMFLPLGAMGSLDARRGRAGTPGSRVASLAGAALLLQGAFLYLVVAVSKFQYATWWEGRSLYAVLQKDSYARPLGEYLLAYPDLLSALSWSSMVMESLFPLLLFFPWCRPQFRTLAVLLATGFQLSIFVVADIGTFQPLSILALFPFLPAWFWDRFTRFDGAPRAPAEPPSRGARGAGPLRPVLVGTVGVLLAYMVAGNLLALAPGMRVMPGPIGRVGLVLGLQQRWRMFANADATLQGWHVAIGHLPNGRRVDLIRGGVEPTLERPDDYRSWVPNNGWRIYWSTISKERGVPFRPYLGRYFCNSWNEAHPDEPLAGVEVIFVQKFAHDPALPIRVEPRPLLRGRCPAPEPEDA